MWLNEGECLGLAHIEEKGAGTAQIERMERRSLEGVECVCLWKHRKLLEKIGSAPASLSRGRLGWRSKP